MDKLTLELLYLLLILLHSYISFLKLVHHVFLVAGGLNKVVLQGLN